MRFFFILEFWETLEEENKMFSNYVIFIDFMDKIDILQYFFKRFLSISFLRTSINFLEEEKKVKKESKRKYVKV